MSRPFEIQRDAAATATAVPLFRPLDCILTGYYVVLVAVVLRADRAGASVQALQLGGCALFLFVACVVRVSRGPWSDRRVLIHRTAAMCLLVTNYVMLRDLLPRVQRPVVDGALLAWDRFVFGTTPVMWLERLNTRVAIEYFSFFYLSYFLLTLGVVAAVLYLERPGHHVDELTTGTTLIYCIGQLGYIAVPGHGPIVYLADRFAAPLDGGPLHALLLSIVGAGGALTDVFPSLHTAVPTWLALYAARRAASNARWRVPALVVAFFTVNIVCSTLVLRWHYAVDVLAGLALALCASFATPWLVRAKSSSRTEDGSS